MQGRLRRRARVVFLLLAVLVLAAGFYVYRTWSVRVESVQFQSRLVGKNLEYIVVLPPGYSFLASRKRYPVLYLLHGWNGHPQDWLSQMKLEEYASQHRLIIVLPEGGNGWYTNSATVSTDQYESSALQELIPNVDGRFRTITDRTGRGIAGLSMGGYGALKFGLKHPDVFAFAGSTSGALNTTARTDDDSIMKTFGAADSLTRDENDLFKLASNVSADRVVELPFFYMDCGTEDLWVKTNRDLSRIFAERRIAHEYKEFPGGHDWKYWDARLPHILQIAAMKLVVAQ